MHVLASVILNNKMYGWLQMDKASVLGDAIKYVKQLQEREKVLEEEVATKTVESAVLLRRTVVSGDVNDSSSSNGPSHSHLPLPEMEARVLGKDVLITIHCHKHNGLEAAILAQLQNLHLTVQSSSILAFGKTTLCITIVAQVNLCGNYSVV